MATSSDKTVLVTGGAGYIGSQCCKLLAANGYTPVCYDDFSNGRRDFVRFGPLVEGDVRDAERLRSAIDEYRPAAAMHFAAKIEVEESVREPLLYYDVNVGGTIALAKACREGGIRHLIFSSTAAVYGETTDHQVGLTTPAKPINPYGQSKLTAEQILGDYAASTDVGVTIFRYFNASGADPDGELGIKFRHATHLVPRLVMAAEEKKPFFIFGTDYPTPDGTCIRDYIHVWDLASAHVAALDKPVNHGHTRTYNVGIGRGYSVREVIESVERVTGTKLEIIEKPRRAGDAASLIAGDTEKTRTDLDWSPLYPKIDDIVRDGFGWYRVVNRKCSIATSI